MRKCSAVKRKLACCIAIMIQLLTTLCAQFCAAAFNCANISITEGLFE
jgi:hypothetical protein